MEVFTDNILKHEALKDSLFSISLCRKPLEKLGYNMSPTIQPEVTCNDNMSDYSKSSGKYFKDFKRIC